MRICRGSTRFVIVIWGFAIKLPYITKGFKTLLLGLLGNMQEVQFNTLKDKRLCPVLCYLPCGLCLVMPECRILTEAEYSPEVYERISYAPGFPEPKATSFGWLDGRIVAVDYGDHGQ